MRLTAWTGASRRERLDALGPAYTFCRSRGLAVEGEAIRIGDWPVQFVRIFSPLTEAAVRDADTVDFEGVPIRVLRADYLAVIALSVGRAQDFARILALLESGSVTRDEIARLAAAHGLAEAWARFERRFFED